MPAALWRPLRGPHDDVSTHVHTTRRPILRPRLHPDMGQVVICARVALQLTAWRYRHYQGMGVPIGYHARFVARILPPDYPGFLRFALHSLGVYLDLGMPSSVWLSNVLEASHFGNSFRRCYFFDYKENRSSYPRVTNRGVQTSKGGRKSKHRRLSDDA
jgi:hypothetical protein